MKIVITGARTGIGAAIAARLRADGHQVAGLARSPAPGQPPAGQLELEGDVSRWDDMAAAATVVQERWGGAIDGVVCCAAVQGEAGPALAANPAIWARTVEIDLIGTFHTLRAFAPLLQPAPPRRAKAVCFSGGGATKGRPHYSAYGAAKTGLVRLVETIALEEKPRGLDINAVAPGAIRTRLTDEVIAAGPERAGTDEYQAALKTAAGGGASLDRAVDLVAWLLSPASDGISGRLISAPWDPWDDFGALRPRLESPGDDLYTLRRNTR